MDIDQKVVERLNALIQLGHDAVEANSGFGGGSVTHEWFVGAASILKRVFGEDSLYYQQFLPRELPHVFLDDIQRGIGVLDAALSDYAGGYLFSVRKLIQAEVFDEFLDQAHHLYESGYYQPAAVVAGAVLEDGLRKLCSQHNIALSDKPKLDTMNADLVKAGAYNKLTQKQVTADADLRNKAAHGQWNEFTEDDVFRMISSVRIFMEKHFT